MRSRTNVWKGVTFLGKFGHKIQTREEQNKNKNKQHHSSKTLHQLPKEMPIATPRSSIVSFANPTNQPLYLSGRCGAIDFHLVARCHTGHWMLGNTCATIQNDPFLFMGWSQSHLSGLSLKLGSFIPIEV